MAEDVAKDLDIDYKMQIEAYTYAGVRPEIMGIGPIPATKRVLEVAGLTMDDIGLIELNEAFAVQAVAFINEFGLKFPDDPRLNVYGGAIAFGHPLASSGVRLACHMMHAFAEHPEVKYGLTVMCVGLGQGGAVIWKNKQRNSEKSEKKDKKKKKEAEHAED